jgi:hypothetical protein
MIYLFHIFLNTNGALWGPEVLVFSTHCSDECMGWTDVEQIHSGLQVDWT